MYLEILSNMPHFVCRYKCRRYPRNMLIGSRSESWDRRSIPIINLSFLSHAHAGTLVSNTLICDSRRVALVLVHNAGSYSRHNPCQHLCSSPVFGKTSVLRFWYTARDMAVGIFQPQIIWPAGGVTGMQTVSVHGATFALLCARHFSFSLFL